MNGSLYLASNPEMPGLCKVGRIGAGRRVEARMRELSAPTGVPGHFVHHWVEGTSNPILAERIAHILLSRFKVKHTREFFRCELTVACMGMLVGAQVADKKIPPSKAFEEFQRALEPSPAVLAWRAQCSRRQAA